LYKPFSQSEDCTNDMCMCWNKTIDDCATEGKISLLYT